MATALTTRSFPTFSAVRHQPVATKSAAVRRRYVRQLTTLIGIGVVLALISVWVRIQVIQLGYEMSRLRKETSELKEQKNRLKAEVAMLKVPSRIEVIARERFGMRFPQSQEIVIVKRSEMPSGQAPENQGSESSGMPATPATEP